MRIFKIISVLGIIYLMSACTITSEEPRENIGSGRDERSKSPCACMEIKTEGNDGLHEYRLLMKKRMVS